MSKLPKDCCGCEACAAVCKKGAIKLTRNDEGFYFPVVDASLCVNCGACEKKCPVLNSDRIGKAENTGFFGGYFTASAIMKKADREYDMFTDLQRRYSDYQ